MRNFKNSPGVFIPPPLLFVAVFLIAVLLQKYIPLKINFFRLTFSKIIGVVFILLGVVFGFPALRNFFKTKNTVITFKPANSLQSTGIYSISRNPMYVGMVLLYTGISFLIGGLWNFILIPLLVLIVQEYVIKREEKYLTHRFGDRYLDYKLKVRRWI